MDMKTVKKVYFTWEGRICRKTFWLFNIPIILGMAPAQFSDFTETYEIIYALITLILIYPGLMLNIKRAHDRNRSGWFILLSIVPIISLWPMIELGFIKGNDDGNKYGEPDNIWDS